MLRRFRPAALVVPVSFRVILLLLAFLGASTSASAQTPSAIPGFLARLLRSGRPPAPVVPASSAALAAPVRPDPKLTPGDTLEVTLADIRTPGYSAKVRDVPQEVKRQAYALYGIRTHAKGEYEVDHLIPLSLGGSNSIRNLWPESYLTDPWNAHVKDALEYRLLTLVRAGKVDMKTAQSAIAQDWIAAYKKYVGPGPQHPRGQVAASVAGLPASLPPGIIGASSGRTATVGSVTPAAPPDQKPDMTGVATPVPSAPVPAPRGPAAVPAPSTAAPPIPKAVSASGTSAAPVLNAKGKPQVWLNTRSGAFHRPGSRYYGKTKEGKYINEADALAAGFHAAPDNE